MWADDVETVRVAERSAQEKERVVITGDVNIDVDEAFPLVIVAGRGGAHSGEVV